MIISETTINNSLVDYLSKEGVAVEGTPSSFTLRNVGVNTLNLDIVIWLIIKQ